MILADSTFLIDSLRKNLEVREFLKKNTSEIFFTTEINIFELYLGLYSSKILEKNQELFRKRIKGLEELILKFQVLTFGRGEAIQAAKILGNLNRSGNPIEFRDGLIAGIALFNGINKILTKNFDHFNRIQGIEVKTY
ncbi:MAG: tRNA(fMet)-specific endonuclease VapC [Candidatus Heimdallarchaeota archaeon LC_3]|nr:MAG: tRNA(fMet)-specific endonuclease VapC [Candidatus Heimdallarchaeota archaeon LC_3]OLS21026.1 MAG: tRNA(fMet)-specific endonuclease VapC [Candidatus Heimdallarchaeota archaeon LC_3]